MAKSIGSAVGKQPALNSIKDQQTITTLLNRILPEDGGPTSALPNPTTFGTASQALIDAILNFQRKNVPLRYQDGRVDPHGFTLGRMNALARNFFPVDPPDVPPDPPPFPPPEPDLTSKVKAHINRALITYAHLGEYDRVWAAAWMLKNERNAKVDGKPINCNNKPLAYAEHYMLSRAFVVTGAYWPDIFPIGRYQMWVIGMTAISIYDLGKLANALMALINRFQPEIIGDLRKKLVGLIYKLGDCPMSDGPPDPTSIAWGVQGANDGLTPL